MDQNTFQPANIDRGILVRDNSITGGFTPQMSRMQMQQIQTPRTVPPPSGPQIPRSLDASNWRTHAVEGNSCNSEEPVGHPSTLSAVPNRLIKQLQESSLVPSTNVGHLPVAQVDSSYAYCYDRGNGQYTRLVPADMLPSLQYIPPLQPSSQGMIVLPIPRAYPPERPSSNPEHILVRTPTSSPPTPSDGIQVSLRRIHQYGEQSETSEPLYSYPPPVPGSYHPPLLPASVACDGNTATPCSSDIYSTLPPSFGVSNPPVFTQVQLGRRQLSSTTEIWTNKAPSKSRIDTIVATSPPTPTRGSTQSHRTNNKNNAGVSNISSTPIQLKVGGPSLPHHHHHHHQQQQQQQSQAQQRRPKIYCDKWVHEGVCAFTQQGCKYKHEMPLDTATQQQLGLFHGLPAWWKKSQAESTRHSKDAPHFPTAEAGNGGDSSNIGEAAGGGGGGGSLAWRQGAMSGGGGGGHARTAEPGRLGARELVPENLTMRPRGDAAWSASPYGPIAPPARPFTDASCPQPGPSTRFDAAGRHGGRISTSNPYASLAAQDERPSSTN
ncbi:hypothetical protein BX600DRAFT_537199 [Xylariales sp. PMI_506]|nr:hypothetical protein BX600DRAFT_537199 [Xylariales sp. PMI_506]